MLADLPFARDTLLAKTTQRTAARVSRQFFLKFTASCAAEADPCGRLKLETLIDNQAGVHGRRLNGAMRRLVQSG